jgi:hypothetical protein
MPAVERKGEHRAVGLGHIWGMNHRTTAVTNGLQRKANLPG